MLTLLAQPETMNGWLYYYSAKWAARLELKSKPLGNGTASDTTHSHCLARFLKSSPQPFCLTPHCKAKNKWKQKNVILAQPLCVMKCFLSPSFSIPLNVSSCLPVGLILSNCCHAHAFFIATVPFLFIPQTAAWIICQNPDGNCMNMSCPVLFQHHCQVLKLAKPKMYSHRKTIKKPLGTELIWCYDVNLFDSLK